MKKPSHEVAVGSVVLLGLATVLFGTFWLQGLKFGSEETVIRARFQEVGQIMKGNAVRLRGVPIGRVESIDLEDRGTGVIVTMTIDAEVRLPEDPVVLLSPESMFGDWQAQIFPRVSFPQYAYAEAPDPQILPGYSLPDLTRLTAVADQIATNLAQLTDRFELAFTEETAQNVREAIENIQRVSGQLAGLIERQQKNADEVAADLRTTSESLRAAAETARRAFAHMEEAVDDGRLTAIVDNIQRTTAQADTLAAALLLASRQIQATAISADSALRAVGSVAARIERGEGTLGRLVRDTTLYFRMTETSAELERLLRDFRANPRKYINLTIF